MTGMEAPAIADLASEHRLAVHELATRHASLEQAYLDLTGESVEYRAAPRPQLRPRSGERARGHVASRSCSVARRASTRRASLGMDESPLGPLDLLDSAHRGGHRNRRKRHRGHYHREFRTLADGPLASIFFAWLEYPVLAVGILGVLAFTSEYGTGQIRTTFAAVPQRRAVLTAKAGAVGLLTLCFSELLAFVSFFLSEAILSGHHQGLSLAHPGVLGAVLGAGFSLFAIGLVGVGLGAIIRHTRARSPRCQQSSTSRSSYCLCLLRGRTRSVGTRCSLHRPRLCPYTRGPAYCPPPSPCWWSPRGPQRLC